MTNYVYVGASIDRYIAEIDGGIKWLEEIPNPNKSDFGFSEFLKNIDAVVMGRKTFEKAVTIPGWSYPVPVFVLSTTWKKIPEMQSAGVSLIEGTPREVVNQLHSLGYKNLYIDGGQTIQRFLKEDLVDELTITTVPILLGNGIPLFGNIPNHLRFDLVKLEIVESILVKSTYRRAREK